MNKYVIDGKTYVDVLPPGVEVICDFCSNPKHPFRFFDARDIEIDPDNVSEGGWLVCKECSEFIDNDDFESLQERAIKIFMAKYPGFMTREEIAPAVSLMTAKFRESRK